jgi:ssDNA-binding Zn-finger/Zn-ribbon topoisomerase 1
MKCELCHKADAETAITRGEGDAEEELYVCNACAKAERQRRQKKSQRTRKVTGLPPGMSMSITRISGDDGDGDEPPPILGAIMNAFQDMVSDLEKAKDEMEKSEKKRRAKTIDFPCAGIPTDYRVRDRMHLEGLHLIGELEPVKRAVRALGGELYGIDADGIHETGHAYGLRYTGSSERAERVVERILESERCARVRLFEELPRVFGDSLCRALAIMKNCRLLSSGELFDLLSPMRLAAREKMLDGITYSVVERMMRDVDLSGSEDRLDQDGRDKADAERADEMNRRFEDVVLNERAEEKFL